MVSLGRFPVLPFRVRKVDDIMCGRHLCPVWSITGTHKCSLPSQYSNHTPGWPSLPPGLSQAVALPLCGHGLTSPRPPLLARVPSPLSWAGQTTTGAERQGCMVRWPPSNPPTPSNWPRTSGKPSPSVCRLLLKQGQQFVLWKVLVRIK